MCICYICLRDIGIPPTSYTAERAMFTIIWRDNDGGCAVFSRSSSFVISEKSSCSSRADITTSVTFRSSIKHTMCKYVLSVYNLEYLSFLLLLFVGCLHSIYFPIVCARARARYEYSLCVRIATYEWNAIMCIGYWRSIDDVVRLLCDDEFMRRRRDE